MNEIVFIADFFADEVPGGGELNNQEFIKIVQDKGFKVEKIKSKYVTPDLLEEFNKDTKFILANFIQLSEESKGLIESQKEYVIYEHDHKYIRSRNPADYKDFIAPKEHLINTTLYKNSKAILCQSAFHTDILQSNLPIDNVVNLSGNLWELSAINLMESLSKNDKNEGCSIMSSRNWHKNTADAVKVCNAKGWKYELIPSCSYKEFLKRISEREKFIFLPKTPETLSRIVVEAKMMGVSVITNALVGATKESWFKYTPEALIEEVKLMRERIPNIVMEKLYE